MRARARGSRGAARATRGGAACGASAAGRGRADRGFVRTRAWRTSPREQLSSADGRPLTLATPRAALRERRETFAEAGRGERRFERQARLGGLAPVQRALASEQCVPFGIESLAHQAELVL